ncbi:MAG: FkbM family methyltransferase [Planctomycetales bacterium]|nr:FkbM family methyltransferase [Planctomycetales bacterium]MBN8627623.1 FkbM family methyltransferase [Planctomycetota bacterium]
MECDLRDHVQRHIFFQGAYEPVESFIFYRLAKNAVCVVDGGANVGQYTLLAATASPSVQVHSFEPVECNFAKLKRHVAINALTNITINPTALWNHNEILTLGVSAAEHNNGSYSVGSTESNCLLSTAQAMTFDEYARQRQIERIDLVKLDVEGAERAALQGMKATICKDRPTILMEVNRIACHRLGYEPDEFWRMFVDELGYEAWEIGMSADDWKKTTKWSGRDMSNILFVPSVLPEYLATGWSFKDCLRWAATRFTHRP